MTITLSKVESEIRELETRLNFLRQLREYMRGSVAVPTVTLEPTKEEQPLLKRQGIAATILRKLATDGAAFPDDLMKWFRVEQRKSVINALSLLRRRAMLRDTAKGRVELTTQGIAEAQWFIQNPAMVKHSSPRKEKKGTA